MKSHKVSTHTHTTNSVTSKRRASAQRHGAAIAARNELARDLTPGFRDRLIASLDRAGVPARGRMTYVASLTYRAVQTVSRWLDPHRPGLPDLESCARLCQSLGRSSDWLLGLAASADGNAMGEAGAAAAEFRWMKEVSVALRSACAACETLQMSGDEMAPQIRDGDMMFIDRSADQLAGNGIYALEVDGRLMVRRVESQVGSGLIFKCENQGYADYVLKDAAAAKRMGLRVIGKVKAAVSVAQFWQR